MEKTIALESVLAAVIDGLGVLKVPGDLLKKDRSSMVIAIDYVEKENMLYFTLVEKDDVGYDD